VLLFTLGYDNRASGTSCLSLGSYGNGRLTLRDDSFGKTWYSYDSEGRVLAEVRLRAPATGSCHAEHSNTSPNTNYTYDLNGNLTSIVYPHGRTVNYVYTQTDRPASITYTACSGATPCTFRDADTVIQNITWEPYGGLRA